MPTLSFEGEANGEILVKVRRSSRPVEGAEQANISAVEAVNRAREPPRGASSPPPPRAVAQSDVVKGLTNAGAGHRQHQGRRRLPASTRSRRPPAAASVRQATKAAGKVAYQMSTTMARQLLQSIRG